MKTTTHEAQERATNARSADSVMAGGWQEWMLDDMDTVLAIYGENAVLSIAHMGLGLKLPYTFWLIRERSGKCRGNARRSTRR